MTEPIEEIQTLLKIRFKNPDLIKTALTHRSFLNEHRQENLISNERLEFLGDSILQFWVSKILFERFPDKPEGVLTNMRTRLVRTETLAKISRKLSFGDYLFLSHGEEKGGGRENNALLANTFEAILGAIFLEKGLRVSSNFLLSHFDPLIENLKESKNLKDPKSLLQEKIQVKIKSSPEYRVLAEDGPDHNKTFVIGVYSEGKIIGKGEGHSKQEGEENAARNALEKLPGLG